MKLIPSEPDVRTLIERIDQSDIDLQPDFQRQEVWSTSKKKKLIDTVLRGWSIPPIHLVEIGEGRLEVLDGQQRLAALRDFVHNKFSIDGNISPSDEFISSLHGKFYKKLDPVWRRTIDQFPLRCFKIVDYQPEEPSELFYRLNQPTVLTAGEQRNALYGPAREQLKALVDIFQSSGNDKNSLGFSNIRLAYDDILARLLYFIESSSFGVKATEARISERFRQKRPFSEGVFERARLAIARFSEDRQHATPYRFNKASVLSWLIFFSRFEQVMKPPVGFMQAMIDAISNRFSTNSVSEAAAVFEDRSSLRVTDVSSVVYRDFVLCYIFHFIMKWPLPPMVSVAKILAVESALGARENVPFEQALSEILDVDEWSRTL